MPTEFVSRTVRYLARPVSTTSLRSASPVSRVHRQSTVSASSTRLAIQTVHAPTVVLAATTSSMTLFRGVKPVTALPTASSARTTTRPSVPCVHWVSSRTVVYARVVLLSALPARVLTFAMPAMMGTTCLLGRPKAHVWLALLPVSPAKTLTPSVSLAKVGTPRKADTVFAIVTLVSSSSSTLPQPLTCSTSSTRSCPVSRRSSTSPRLKASVSRPSRLGQLSSLVMPT